MPITTDVRKYSETMREQGKKYGETVREQGKSSMDEVRKLIRAWVGATDLAYDRVRAELKELPARNQEQVHKLQMRAKKLNRAEVRKQVLHTYDDLAKRGEEVIARLRERPQTRLVFTKAQKGLKHAEETVAEAEEHVTGRPAAARKAPAHKTPQKGAAHR
ncbi:MAG: hypothetical protein ACM3ML_12400 [Micromonosporaceae bacterium]